MACGVLQTMHFDQLPEVFILSYHTLPHRSTSLPRYYYKNLRRQVQLGNSSIKLGIAGVPSPAFEF